MTADIVLAYLVSANINITGVLGDNHFEVNFHIRMQCFLPPPPALQACPLSGFLVCSFVKSMNNALHLHARSKYASRVYMCVRKAETNRAHLYNRN